MATYQLENAHKAKLWMKVVAVLLAAVMVIGALVELLCQTSMVKNRLEVSAMMSGYTKDIVDTSKAAAIDKQTMAEDDKVLAVKNRDGSNTAYIFSEPIYYEDADGQIRTKDISIQKVKDKTLSELGYDFENGQNDIRIHFSKDPAVGTKVSSDSWAYSLSPAGKRDSAKSTANLGEKVQLSNMGERFDAFQYKDLYGSGSALNFYPELNGLKDEIILSTVPSSPVFEFTLTTTGATADLNKDGTISIIDKKTKEAVQTMNAPFAYDSEYMGDDPADTK
ncbi:MAG: hypothetical protein II572_05560, partial [Clostridia bacterium]|nr:hypothetical protein [Clostridia bacterium]